MLLRISSESDITPLAFKTHCYQVYSKMRLLEGRILHSGGNHWITISTIGCSDSTVSIYDSIYCTIPECTKKQICALLMSSEAYINLLFVNVDKQANQSDCGLYALAFCTALCAGNDPQNLMFSAGDAMREHLKQCISRQKIEPYPCTVMARRRRVRKMERIEIICLCRSIKFGKVVQCEVCKERVSDSATYCFG